MVSTGYFTDLLQRWDAENAAEGLLTSCRFPALPSAQVEPSERSLRAVVEIISKGSSFASLPEAERRRYLDLTLAIERRTVFVSGEGETLSEGKRLFLAFRAAHVLLVEGIDILNDVHAIVTYGRSARLRRAEREAGLVTIEVPAQIFRRLALLSHWLRELEPATRAGCSRDLAQAVKHAAKAASKTLRRFEEERTFPVAAIAPLLVEVRVLVAGLMRVPADDLGVSLRSLGESLADQTNDIERLAGTLASHPTAGLTLRGASVHVSWLAVITGDIRGSDVVAHELAHVLHSRADLTHYLTTGLPVPAGLTRSTFARDLDALFTRAKESDELDFLGTYAKTSASELFAVASEHYLCDSGALRLRSEELHELLHAFYGPRALVFERRSSLHLLGSFVGPLSVLRDT